MSDGFIRAMISISCYAGLLVFRVVKVRLYYLSVFVVLLRNLQLSRAGSGGYGLFRALCVRFPAWGLCCSV